MNSSNAPIETVAKILIVNEKHEALVLILGKHLKSPEKSFLPDLPGGIVELGESEQIAAIREVKEEAGIEIDTPTMQLVYAETAFYPQEQKSVTKLLYVAHIAETPNITLSCEHSDYKWVSLHKLDSVAFRPFFKRAVNYSAENKLL